MWENLFLVFFFSESVLTFRGRSKNDAINSSAPSKRVLLRVRRLFWKCSKRICFFSLKFLYIMCYIPTLQKWKVRAHAEWGPILHTRWRLQSGLCVKFPQLSRTVIWAFLYKQLYGITKDLYIKMALSPGDTVMELADHGNFPLMLSLMSFTYQW